MNGYPEKCRDCKFRRERDEAFWTESICVRLSGTKYSSYAPYSYAGKYYPNAMDAYLLECDRGQYFESTLYAKFKDRWKSWLKK